MPAVDHLRRLQKWETHAEHECRLLLGKAFRPGAVALTTVVAAVNQYQ
jgi:hypothetical protein